MIAVEQAECACCVRTVHAPGKATRTPNAPVHTACAGFGSVCTLATMYWTFFKGAAIMAIIYPLFILVACKSDPVRAYREGAQSTPQSSAIC